jgi:hypothetical protein
VQLLRDAVLLGQHKAELRLHCSREFEQAALVPATEALLRMLRACVLQQGRYSACSTSWISRGPPECQRTRLVTPLQPSSGQGMVGTR